MKKAPQQKADEKHPVSIVMKLLKLPFRLEPGLLFSYLNDPATSRMVDYIVNLNTIESYTVHPTPVDPIKDVIELYKRLITACDGLPSGVFKNQDFALRGHSNFHPYDQFELWLRQRYAHVNLKTSALSKLTAEEKAALGL